MSKRWKQIDLLAAKEKPKIESYQMDVSEFFGDFNEIVRYHGSPHMARDIELLHKLTFEAVAKSFNNQQLDECIQNFVQKIKDLSYVNGYLDVTIDSLNKIQDVWMNTMFDIQADWVFNGVFDCDDNKYELRVNVGRYNTTVGTVNLERTLTKR